MPLDYTMCCQPVTVYRKQGQSILRQVIHNCFLQWQDKLSFDAAGKQKDRSFLLIQPGKEQLVFPGDRIFDGIGPEITGEQWDTFLPVNVNGLVEAAYATAFRWQGSFCHTEAGRK